jgi:hypothetical protein
MITYDAAARDELLAMHDSYALRDPVVVFGMAAKLIAAIRTATNSFRLDWWE